MNLSVGFSLIFMSVVFSSCSTTKLKNYTGSPNNPYLENIKLTDSKKTVLLVFGENKIAFEKLTQSFLNSPMFSNFKTLPAPQKSALVTIDDTWESISANSGAGESQEHWWKPLLSIQSSALIKARTQSLLDYESGNCFKAYKNQMESLQNNKGIIGLEQNQETGNLTNTEILYKTERNLCLRLAQLHFSQIDSESKFKFVVTLSRNKLIESRILKAAENISQDFLAAFRYKTQNSY